MTTIRRVLRWVKKIGNLPMILRVSSYTRLLWRTGSHRAYAAVPVELDGFRTATGLE